MTDEEIAKWTAYQTPMEPMVGFLGAAEVREYVEDWIDIVLTRETFYLTARQFVCWLAKEASLSFSAADAAAAFKEVVERRWGSNPIVLDRLITGAEWDAFYAKYGGSQRVALVIAHGEVIDFYKDDCHKRWNGSQKFVNTDATYYFPTPLEATFARMYF